MWGYPCDRSACSDGPPRSTGGGALQAGRMAAGLGRRRRHCFGLGVHHEVSVADGPVADGELEDPVEHQAAAAGSATVEAEHELVEVAGQMGGVHRALVGAQQPPLDQRRDPVDRGNPIRSRTGSDG